MADRASELLFEELSREGLGLTALFGLPSSEHRERAGSVVREMYEAASSAQDAVAREILDLDSSPRFRDEADLQQRRRDLAEVQRDRRIPFLLGIASALHAELNVRDAAERRRLHAQAERLLVPLVEPLDGVLEVEARLYAGLARVRLGQHDAAEAMLAPILLEQGATPVQIFTMRLIALAARVQRDGAAAGLEALDTMQAGYSGPQHLFHRVIMADQRFMLLRKQAAEATSDRRDQLNALAFAAYTDLLRTETNVSRETIRAIVFARLTHAADLNLPETSLPDLAMVARAEHQSRHEATRAAAIVKLEQALNRPDFDSDARPAALFVLGRALAEHGERFFAAQRFIQLAAQHPADWQAERAIEAGVALARDLHRLAPDDPEYRQTYREGLEVLLARYPNLPSIDRWRYEAGRLAMEQERLDEAMRLFQQVTPAATHWHDAHFMQVVVKRHAAEQAGEAQRRPANQEVLDVIERVRPIVESGLRGADGERAAALQQYLALLRIYRAEALLNTDQPQHALRELEQMEAVNGASPAIVGETLRVRIAAYRAARQPESAMLEIQRYVNHAPDQALATLPPMLESMRREVQALLDAGRDDQAVTLARQTLVPVAELLDELLALQAGKGDGGARRLVADAYRLADRHADALSHYERLLQAQPDAANLLLGKAECLFGLGGEERLAEAMSIYKRLAADGPRGAAGHDTYWLAQLRMLQIIDRVGRHTEQIAPRIERLRQQERALGGERFRRGFDALRMKYR